MLVLNVGDCHLHSQVTLPNRIARRDVVQLLRNVLFSLLFFVVSTVLCNIYRLYIFSVPSALIRCFTVGVMCAAIAFLSYSVCHYALISFLQVAMNHLPAGTSLLSLNLSQICIAAG